MDYLAIKKHIVYLQALVIAHEAVEAGKAAIENQAGPTIEEQKISARNIALANDPESLKGKLLGTLTTEPIINQNILENEAGMDSAEAAAIIAEVNRIRPEALALTAAEPKEIIK